MSKKDIQANNQANDAYDYLLKLLVETDDRAHLSAIFDALMTEKEQTELANRLTIFALLQQGMTQREISAQLVSVSQRCRGALRCLANTRLMSYCLI